MEKAVSPLWNLFRIPETWLGPFSPVVALQGLDLEKEAVDRAVWEILNLQSQTAPKDFTPTFLLNPVLPPKKPRREGLEFSTYVPSGLFPADWAEKHRGRIPAVMVAFFKDDPVHITKSLAKLKADCAHHGTQLLVMLVKGPGEEEVNTERASAICAAADIPPKSLYILITTNSDRIQTSVHRLETGIREAAKNYYSSRVRRLKSNKERTTQSALQVRYNIKVAFFMEVRKDYTAAFSHYDMASDGLERLGLNLHEIRVVASILNYRACRLHLLRRDWAEAKTQFVKHIKKFVNSVISPKLTFQHLAFLQQQYHNFGELAKQYYRGDSGNALDPVSYFSTAAKYAQQRAVLLQQRLSKGPIEAPTELVSPDWKGKYLGQRPWELDQEEHNLNSLQYFESISAPSEEVINNLGLASEFCKDVGRLRTRCQLMSMMGEEFLRTGEFSRCTLLMGHVLREFGSEKWGKLLLHVARVGLRAALALPDVPAYLNFVVLLLKRDLRPLLQPDEGSSLARNLNLVINKSVPQHDGVDTSSFSGALNAGEIKSYVGVHTESFIQAVIGFRDENAFVQRKISVVFQIKNVHDHSVHIKSVGIQTNLPDYDAQKRVDKELGVNEVLEESVDITPLPRDANKIIQLQMGTVDIGKGDVAVLLHYSLIHKPTPTLWIEWSEENRLVNVVKVEPSKHVLQCKVEREDPALIGEPHKITFRWVNEDEDAVTKLMFNYFLSATNPQLVRIIPGPSFLSDSPGSGPGSAGGGLSFSEEVVKLEGGGAHETTLHVRFSGLTELRIIAKSKYMDSVGQPVGTDCVTHVPVIHPFALTTAVQDTQGETLTAVAPVQPFVMYHQIANASSTKIRVIKVDFKTSHSCIVQHGADAGFEDEELVLSPCEALSAMQLLTATQIPAPELPTVASILIHWSRASEGSPGPLVSELSVPTPRFEETPTVLYLTGEFGEGILKREMSASYVLVNRSPIAQDLVISIDSTEYFMNAGPKRLSMKLNAMDNVRLSYTFFPLKTGILTAPKLIVEGPDPAVPLPVHRDIPKVIFVRQRIVGDEPC